MWTIREYEGLINTLGLNANYYSVKTRANKTIKIGFATVTKEDTAVINAYGIGARIITLKASDHPTPPAKFDYVTIGTEKFVFDTVNSVHLPNSSTVVGYRCFVRGG